MPILFKNNFILAKKSIRHHRTRSLITCLGVAIGIACITLILSLIGSINSLLESEISTMGEGLAVVRPVSALSSVDQVIGELTLSASSLSPSLTMKDVKSISELENIESVAPIALSLGTIAAYDKTIDSVSILATTSGFKSIKNLAMKNGIFLGPETPDNAIILGSSVANALFGTAEPISKTINILGEKFIILGVLAPLDNPINITNINLDEAVIVNANYFSTLNTSLNISQINVKVKETASLENTKSAIKDTLKKTKSGDTNFEVLSGSEITRPTGSLLWIISIILGVIALISLIVGGVGIMNIMLVTITERTHEIGIKKAIGASNSNILSEYILESALISFRGSILGVILGYILALIISLISPFGVYVTWPIIGITLGTGLATGIIFGLIPAARAAHKDPIRSLKTYY